METNFWASRLQLVKGHSLVVSRSNHLNDHDGDDDLRACIACPICDVDVEVQLLYSHLQEDHGFEFKNAVCPLCALTLGKDFIGHFTANHSSSLKHKRKSQKPSLWNSTSSILGKELSLFLGSSTNNKGNDLEGQPESSLSPFHTSMSRPGSKGTVESVSAGCSASIVKYSKRAERPLLNGNLEVDHQVRKRVAFVQDLISSAIFWNDHRNSLPASQKRL